MNKKVVLDYAAYKKMILHAEWSFPDECCGFFYGNDDNETRMISIAEEVENTKEGDKKRRFEISPLDYIKAEKYALEHNISLLGVYHSHPQHPAIPSDHYLKQAMPWFSYVIISVMDNKTDHVRSWRIDEINNEFEEEKLTIKT